MDQRNHLFLVAQLKLEAGVDQFYDKILMQKSLLKGETALSPAQWWRLMGQRIPTLPSGLTKLAEELMMLPASTSAIERCFSTMGSIMTKTRNRIGIEKAGKLCFIYRTLNSGRFEDENVEMD